MVLVPYPGTPRHQSVELQPIAAARVNTSALSNARQAVDMGYSWWEAAVTVAPMTIDDAREWRVFFGRLRGAVHSFRLPVTSAAQHDGSFIARANGAGGGYSLASDGWPVSTKVLLAGDFVTVGDQLMALDIDVDTDATGNATLQFHAPLRRSIADDTIIETKRPFLTAWLPEGAPALTLNSAQLQDGFSFAATEAY
ncbi:hypothetical protein V5F89_12485 [Pelagerythrobacter marensis]|uniref:Uncharacterized protein n=1 Tax=Pelagerythrobacter marensis TaxID=543877 RepID=A0ABZ2D412_9SPHN